MLSTESGVFKSLIAVKPTPAARQLANVPDPALVVRSGNPPLEPPQALSALELFTAGKELCKSLLLSRDVLQDVLPLERKDMFTSGLRSDGWRTIDDECMRSKKNGIN